MGATMSEPVQVKEPIEDRAARGLNTLMRYILGLLATVVGGWFTFTAISDLGPISGALSSGQQDKLWMGLLAFSIALSGVTALLPDRKPRTPK